LRVNEHFKFTQHPNFELAHTRQPYRGHRDR